MRIHTFEKKKKKKNTIKTDRNLDLPIERYKLHFGYFAFMMARRKNHQ